MALVNVQEEWSDGTVSVEGRRGRYRGWTRTSMRIFTVLFDDPADGEHGAMNAAGIPVLGDAHPDNANEKMYLKRATTKSPLLFRVTCEYTGVDTPLTEAPEKSWEGVTSVEPIDQTADGDPIENSIGDPINGVTMEVKDAVYVFVRNEAAEPIATIKDYRNTVNSDVFKGHAIGEARMIDITAVQMSEDIGGSFYWRVTYRIAFRQSGADAWKIRVLNEANRTSMMTSSDMVPIKLDGTRAGAGDHVWLYFKVYADKAFAGLGID